MLRRCLACLVTSTIAHAAPPPEVAPHVSFGLGEALISGPMSGSYYQATIGVRIARADWIGVSYNWLDEIDDETIVAPDVWDLELSAARVVHATGGLHLVGTVALGYEHAYFRFLQDLDPVPPQTLQRSNAFLEARGAFRLDLVYAWLELSLGLRGHLLFDPRKRDSRATEGTLVGAALHIAL